MMHEEPKRGQLARECGGHQSGDELTNLLGLLEFWFDWLPNAANARARQKISLKLTVREDRGEVGCREDYVFLPSPVAPPVTFWYLELALDYPESFADLLCKAWPQLETFLGGLPDRRDEAAVALALGAPGPPESLRESLELLWDAFDLWLACPPGNSEWLPPWLPREAVGCLERLRPAERFLATSPEGVVYDREISRMLGLGNARAPRHIAPRYFVEAFPHLRRWWEIREALKDALLRVRTVPWPESPSSGGALHATLKDHLMSRRRWVERCSSSSLVALAWAELVHYARSNAKGRYCAACGRRLIAPRHQAGKKRLYCSERCRRTADPSRSREYARLYMRYRRGKLSWEEFDRLCREKGLKKRAASRRRGQ